MQIKRIRNNKEEIFERKEREKIYNLKITLRVNEKEYNSFVEKCKNNDKKTSKVIRELMNNYCKEKY